MRISYLIRNAILLLAVLGFLSATAIAGPVYQEPQGVGSTTTLSGSGTYSGGTADLTAWFWDGGNGYDYYAYRIVDTSNYHPYIDCKPYGNRVLDNRLIRLEPGRLILVPELLGILEQRQCYLGSRFRCPNN